MVDKETSFPPLKAAFQMSLSFFKIVFINLLCLIFKLLQMLLNWKQKCTTDY